MTDRVRERAARREERGEGAEAGANAAAAPGSADAWRERAAQLLPTEHFTLQSARAITVADASSRATLYLTSISISLVALGLVGQTSGLERALHTFGLVLFPTRFFLGLATFVRVARSAVEDLLSALGINRIRRFSVASVPESAPYFILSTHDDMPGVMRNMAARPSSWQRFLTTAGTIGVVTSVGGVGATGIALDVARWPFPLVLPVAAIACGVGIALHDRAQQTMLVEARGGLEVRFPSPAGARGAADGPDAETTAAPGRA